MDLICLALAAALWLATFGLATGCHALNPGVPQ